MERYWVSHSDSMFVKLTNSKDIYMSSSSRNKRSRNAARLLAGVASRELNLYTASLEIMTWQLTRCVPAGAANQVH